MRIEIGLMMGLGGCESGNEKVDLGSSRLGDGEGWEVGMGTVDRE